MKKLILLGCFICLSISVIADDFPTGFWGIEFGAKKDEVKRIMSQKQGIKFNGDVEGSLAYEGGEWAGKSISMLYFEFYRGMMISATVVLSPSEDRYILTLYDDVVSEVNMKYFTTKKMVKNFEPPFSNVEGYELLAIESGKASIFAMWDFDYSKITAIVLKDMKVVVRYEDIVGKDLKSKEETNKNMLDM